VDSLGPNDYSRVLVVVWTVLDNVSYVRSQLTKLARSLSPSTGLSSKEREPEFLEAWSPTPIRTRLPGQNCEIRS